MLTYNDEVKINELVDNLLVYINERFRIIEDDDFDDLTLAGDLAREEGLDEILHMLWENTSIIDEYVNSNPFHLNKSDLEIVSTWKDAYPTGAYCFDVQDGKALVLAGDRVLAVESPHALEMKGKVMSATFLPYKEFIIEDSYTAFIPSEFGEGLKKEFEKWIDKAMELGVISTSSEFVDYARA